MSDPTAPDFKRFVKVRKGRIVPPFGNPVTYSRRLSGYGILGTTFKLKSRR